MPLWIYTIPTLKLLAIMNAIFIVITLIGLLIMNRFSKAEGRVDLARTAITKEIWVVLFLSSLITLAINIMVGMRWRWLVASSIGMGSMIGSMIYLVAILDRPFSGEFSVKPTAFEHILQQMSQPPKP